MPFTQLCSTTFIVEITVTLAFAAGVISILLYNMIFNKVEPISGWWCLYCDRQEIGTRDNMEYLGWTVNEKALLCPMCARGISE